MFSFFRPFIFKLDPERAHRLAVESLKLNYLPKSFFKTENEEMLEINVFNKKFPNPIGLAAGFDKSAEVYNSLLDLDLDLWKLALLLHLDNTEILSQEYLD